MAQGQLLQGTRAIAPLSPYKFDLVYPNQVLLIKDGLLSALRVGHLYELKLV